MADTDSLSDQEILARTIYGEARGEIYQGKQAIASVVLNRAAHGGWWGTDVRSVCLKPYQFSCWLESDPNRPQLMAVSDNDLVFMECLDITESALAGTLYDVTDGSDSYFARGTPTPIWAENLQPWIIIGNHEFYKTV